MDKYVALIPARGGSKSIPLKNIKSMAGKPLIHWAIKAALNCPKIDKVYLSTDSNEIARVASLIKNKKLEVIGRNPSTATDAATTESAMLDFSKDHDFENIILIEATCPLLTSRDLTNAINIVESNEYASSLISLVEQKRFIWKSHSPTLVVATNYNPLHRPRRQEFEGFLVENGAISITSKKMLEATGCRVSGNTTYYVMSEDNYYEIE